jgi:hypothetical protein
LVAPRGLALQFYVAVLLARRELNDRSRVPTMSGGRPRC